MYDGLSSFSKEEASQWLSSETVWKFNPHLVRIESRNCSIDRLDEFNLRPFFLKIHVQGFEASVLKGAEDTIATHNPVLLLANNKEADLWIRAHGWAQYAFRNSRWHAQNQNDLSVYSCVYLNQKSKQHPDIISSFDA